VCPFLCLSVGSSVWNNSAPKGRIFMKFDIWVFFCHLSRKVKFHSNLTRITGTLHEGQCRFLSISCSFLLRKRNVSDKSCRIHPNTILFSIIIFENRAVYKIIWKNIVERSMPQLTIWCMLIACWTTKATNTNSEYNIIPVPLQQ